MQQCVFYDLLLHKYTQNELFTTSDVWAFLKAHSSPARAFLYKNRMTVCKEGAAGLDKERVATIASTAAKYGPRVLENRLGAKANLLAYLDSSYAFLTQLSEQEAAILQRNLIASSYHQFAALGSQDESDGGLWVTADENLF